MRVVNEVQYRIIRDLSYSRNIKFWYHIIGRNRVTHFFGLDEVSKTLKRLFPVGDTSLTHTQKLNLDLGLSFFIGLSICFSALDGSVRNFSVA